MDSLRSCARVDPSSGDADRGPFLALSRKQHSAELGIFTRRSLEELRRALEPYALGGNLPPRFFPLCAGPLRFLLVVITAWTCADANPPFPFTPRSHLRASLCFPDLACPGEPLLDHSFSLFPGFPSL